MESVKDRALRLVNASPRTWSANEMMKEMCCSYSTARVALKQLCDEGKVQRITHHRNARAEYIYYRYVASERPRGLAIT